MCLGKKSILFLLCQSVSTVDPEILITALNQARKQLGTPGVVKSFLRGPHF